MTAYVLDTDTLSLLQRGNPVVGAHFSRYHADEVATTIVSVEEQLSGWYTLAEAGQDGAGTGPRLRAHEGHDSVSELTPDTTVYRSSREQI